MQLSLRPGDHVAIIGRGLAGLALARQLSAYPLRISVFGHQDIYGNASRCAQGIVCQKGLIFAESPLFQLKLASQHRLTRWLDAIEAESLRSIRRWQLGVVEPYWTEQDFYATAKRVYRGNFLGCYRSVNRKARPHPYFAEPLGQLYYPADTWFDVPETLDALEHLLRLRAVELSRDRLLQFEMSQDKAKLTLEHGELEVDHLILAAGAETFEILGRQGYACPKHFLISGQSLEWQPEDLDPALAEVQVKGTLSLAFLPEKAILGSSSFLPQDLTSSALQKDSQQLWSAASQSFGLQTPLSEVKSRVGTRLRFADRMPAIGLWPQADRSFGRLWLFTGLYKNGLQLAEYLAEQLALALWGQEMDPLAKEFSPTRLRLLARNP